MYCTYIQICIDILLLILCLFSSELMYEYILQTYVYKSICISICLYDFVCVVLNARYLLFCFQVFQLGMHAPEIVAKARAAFEKFSKSRHKGR